MIATFPTCHLEVFTTLTALGLPQRYLVTVHNPDALNNTDVSGAIAASGARMLTIAPHVGKYAAQVLVEQGLKVGGRGGVLAGVGVGVVVGRGGGGLVGR